MGFPLISPAALFDHTPSRPPPPVLVVDDEEHLATMLKLLLERNGFLPTVCSDLASAREALSTSEFEAALVDLKLGGDSGLDVLWEAARAQPQMARLLMSASMDLQSVMGAVNGVGVFQVLDKPLRHPELLLTLDRACSMTRVTRDRDRLQAQLTERSRQLEELNAALSGAVLERTSDLLSGMLAALDFRDTESRNHSRRVAAYARRLGLALGLTGRDLLDATMGALLHDIGKMAIPDAVLRKRGPLSAEEWLVMQTHPAQGDRLLEPIPVLQGARRVVLQHHERWDGTGYPAGLRGDAIDLGARVFAVVDAHDAITTDRPHRPGRDLRGARDLVALAGGTQFDPAVVQAWLRIPETELEGVRQRYRDDSPWTSVAELLAGLS